MTPGIALHHLRLGLVLVGVLLIGTVASISPALADLRVCNETGNPVSIALGYRAERGWQSEGWWLANPTQCATVYQGDLTTSGSSFFYLYVADDIGGGAWDGSFFMCTRDESFTIFEVDNCLARGYERTGFFEVDTQNRSDWTLQLTEAVEPGLPPDGATDLDDPTLLDVPLDDVDPVAPDSENLDTQ